jgi:Tfp pilus assembly protein, pilus retraction ATPase PilT
VNRTRHEHIITLEDPIEYLFTPQGCQVNQREVHTHTESFGAALRGALREDPDVIMVGEMRDLETISLAITASETGHLVSVRSIPPMQPVRSTVFSTFSPWTSANKSASWSANHCAESSRSNSCPAPMAQVVPWQSKFS